ncbi:hypothetical protein CCR94_16200 [Rhodoblastus sphagnicola]|uniref:Uncharacterized protein n=1 Tax=Rhodoblastus sphagnicola TaxID=333368 RepID=A0A2S6N2S8_9HYPH|nr:hypothetical protein [Rhodoblastus sphagnicola]MBB4199034.1 ABC-type amino acid transport substrate-binding protein [Rhodoblastus sphagnicola]PPQ28931.1 hypothetical protein CCR94_16200 [Rhodoblastus sphagnicola]
MIRISLAGALACALFASTASAMSYKLPTADQIQQDAKTAAAVAQIFACDISAAANIALVAEEAANSGGQVVRTGTTTKIVGVSTALCGAIGGASSTIAVSAVPASR